MAIDAIKIEIAKLKRLVQYRSADDTVLEKQAEKNVILQELVEDGNFISDVERNQAKKIFVGFLKTHTFDTLSDLNTLSTLTYNMILLGRIQKSINGCSTNDGKTFISDKLLKSMHEVENQIADLKVKLGIDREIKTDEFSALQLLKKRFAQHIQENRNEFTLSVPYECSSCGKSDIKMILVRRRVKDFEAIDHPHFSGRFWYNEVAMNMVESGTLKKEDYAKIFATSVDYVNWAIANKGRILPTTENK